jgi:hypothetical protein
MLSADTAFLSSVSPERVSLFVYLFDVFADVAL